MNVKRAVVCQMITWGVCGVECVLWLSCVVVCTVFLGMLWLMLSQREVNAIQEAAGSACVACHLVFTYAATRSLSFILRNMGKAAEEYLQEVPKTAQVVQEKNSGG